MGKINIYFNTSDNFALGAGTASPGILTCFTFSMDFVVLKKLKLVHFLSQNLLLTSNLIYVNLRTVQCSNFQSVKIFWQIEVCCKGTWFCEKARCNGWISPSRIYRKKKVLVPPFMRKVGRIPSFRELPKNFPCEHFRSLLRSAESPWVKREACERYMGSGTRSQCKIVWTEAVKKAVRENTVKYPSTLRLFKNLFPYVLK